MSHYYKLIDGFYIYPRALKINGVVNPNKRSYILYFVSGLIGKALWKLSTINIIKPRIRRSLIILFIIQTLNENPEKMDWTMFSLHPDAIPKIKKYMDKIPNLSKKIDWEQLFYSSSILTYDYEKIRAHCLIYKEELIASFYAPKNMRNFEMNSGFNERWVN
jgi:hypothetical protein